MFTRLRLIREMYRNRSFILKLPIIFRMLKQAIKGKYKMKKSTIFYMILALFYILFPIDFIPDWLVFIGWFDDIGVLTLLISKLIKETENFVIWEQYNK